MTATTATGAPPDQLGAALDAVRQAVDYAAAGVATLTAARAAAGRPGDPSTNAATPDPSRAHRGGER